MSMTEEQGTSPLEDGAGDLARAATRGVFWSGTSQVVTQAIGFSVNIVIARLLYPEDFGILGMAAMFIELVSLVGDLGLSAAIIQRKQVTQLQLSTCFWINLLIGAGLVAASFLFAPFIARFFERDIVGPVVFVSSFGFLIRSAGSVHRAILTRQLEFKKLAIPEIATIVTYGVIVVPMALIGMSFWSVVIANLISAMVTTVLFWVYCSWRPGRQFDWSSFRELMAFGVNVFGEQVLGYVNLNIDYLLIGKLLGAASLGIYTLAFNLMTFPLRKIAQMVTRVTFPAFSRVQSDDALLRVGYLKTVRYISLVTFPVLTGLGIVAPDFIRLVYGSKWTAAILPLQIMCIDGLIRTVGTTVGSVLYAKGRADIGFRWKILTVLVIPPFILAGMSYGIVGVSIAVACATLLLAPIIQLITNRLIGLRMASFGHALTPAFVGSLIMAGWLVGLAWGRNRVWPEAEYTFLMVVAASGAGVYLASIRFVFRETYAEMLGLIGRLRE